jgi:hypothetical protein
MSRRAAFLVVLLSAIAATSASAQGAGGLRKRDRVAPRGGAQGQERQQLEQKFRRGVARVVKQRLELSDDQMSRLSRSSSQFDARRRTLIQDERAQRLALRAEIKAGPSGDQNKIAGALDRLLELQRQRVELQIEEQREFATFLSPLQRAKYFALQEQLRRRMEGLRRAQSDTLADANPRD